MPLVSVIVPLFNKSRTIGRTLSSILGQTYKSIEVIVVDDGSTDDSAAKVAAFVDSRIHLCSQANAGCGAARNHGTALSHGTLIAFLDADDEWDPDFLRVAVDALNEHRQCAVFVSNTKQGSDGKKQWDPLRDDDFREGPWRIPPNATAGQVSRFFAGFSSSSIVYRKESLIECGGFYSENHCHFAEDLYLWIQVVLKHSIYRHMAPLAWYHTEDSEMPLCKRRELFALEPSLTHADQLRQQCPAILHDLLERWLAERALDAAFFQLKGGHFQQARRLMEIFPKMRDIKYRFAKLRLRTAFPRSWQAYVEGRRAVHKTASSFLHVFQHAYHRT